MVFENTRHACVVSKKKSSDVSSFMYFSNDYETNYDLSDVYLYGQMWHIKEHLSVICVSGSRTYFGVGRLVREVKRMYKIQCYIER